jgi:hypothetical protein
MQPSPPAARGTDRFLLGIVVGAALLIVVGIVAVFVTSRTAALRPVDPDSPAGVVQAYVEALRAGDLDRAYGYLSRAAQASVSLDDYRRRAYRPFVPDTAEQRVLVEPVTVGADTATVRVTISRFTARADPFSTSTYHQDTTVALVREDGAWRISRPVEPYPFY